MAEDLGRFVLRGTLATLAIQVLAVGLSFGGSLVLARVLGADGFGTWSYASTWSFLLLTPATLGLGAIVTREIASAEADGRWARVRGAIRFGGWTALVAGAVTAGAGAVVVELLRDRLGDRVATTLLIAMPVTMVSGGLLMARQVLIGFKRVVWSQAAESVLRPALQLLLVGVGVAAGAVLDPPAVMALYGVASLLTLAVVVWIVGQATPAPARKVAAEAAVGAWLRSALPMLFTGLARDINNEASMLVIGSFLPAHEAGIYRAAQRVASLPSFVLTAVNLSLNPVAAALFARNDLAQLERIAIRSARGATLVAGAMVLVLAASGGWLLSWFGPEFVEGWPVLVIMSLGHLYNVATGSVGVILIMSRHEDDTARVLAFTSVVTLAGSALLVRWLGLLGAGIATAATLVLWNTLLLTYVWRRLGIVPAAWVWRRTSA